MEPPDLCGLIQKRCVETEEIDKSSWRCTGKIGNTPNKTHAVTFYNYSLNLLNSTTCEGGHVWHEVFAQGVAMFGTNNSLEFREEGTLLASSIRLPVVSTVAQG